MAEKKKPEPKEEPEATDPQQAAKAERQDVEAQEPGEGINPERRVPAFVAPKVDDPWFVWKGKAGQHTPPLPSRDLDEATVRLLVGSMDEVESYVKTGLWESNVPKGAFPKERKAPEG